MNSDKSLIDYKIKKRNDIYFLVTESDLNEIKSKSNYADWSFLFASIFLGSFVSIIITLAYGIDFKPDAKNILYVLLWVFGILSGGCVVVSIILHQSRKKVIDNIKGKEDISLHVNKYHEQPNPEKYKGHKNIGLNVDVHQKQDFFKVVQNDLILNFFKSTNHENSKKKDYFTFVIHGVNDDLGHYLKNFLAEKTINYIDFKYV